jgi:adenylate cyclase
VIEDNRPMRISTDELAQRLGVDVAEVERLVAAGAIEPPAPGWFQPGDIHHVRLLLAFSRSGVPLDALVRAYRAGEVTFAFYDRLHPPIGTASQRSYRAFAGDQGDKGALLARLFTAFGIAEPDPETHLSPDDEALVAELLDILVASGHPDLVLRAVRMYGLGAQRATDVALSAYQEAIDPGADMNPAFYLTEQFEPWARLARLSPALSGWLMGQHMTRAIDTYSILNTERMLEEAGYVAQREARLDAVAFVDLTGFTRLTEELGDEAAAALALRLGELAAESIAAHGGRLVKLLGDGALLRFDGLRPAINGTLDLLDALPIAGLPTGHAGVTAGPIVSRDGDVFGRTVNLAARISDVAVDGRLLAPAALAAELPPEAYAVEPAGASVLQGIGAVDLVAVSRRTS